MKKKKFADIYSIIRLDSMEINERNKTVIMTGLPNESKGKDEAARSLNESLGTRIAAENIAQTYIVQAEKER